MSAKEDPEYTFPRNAKRPANRLSTAGLLAALALCTTLFVLNLTTTARRVKASQTSYFSSSWSPEETLKTAAASTQPSTPYECGQTVAEAQANSCPFDIMSNLWLPQKCHNATFMMEPATLNGVDKGAAEFGLKDYDWFEDEALSRPLTTAYALEQFLAQQDKQGLPLEAFTHMSFHAAHCSYLARVATNGLERVTGGETDVWIPEVAANPSHARHCEHVFGELYRLGERGERRNWTQVGFGIAPCVKVG